MTLGRFEATLRTKLKEEGDGSSEQFALFSAHDISAAERRQYDEDRTRWQQRLDGLPGELERELAATATRYHDARAHLFPVAVVFRIRSL